MNIGSSMSMPLLGISAISSAGPAAVAPSAAMDQQGVIFQRAPSEPVPADGSQSDGQDELQGNEPTKAAERGREPLEGLTPEEQQEVRELAARDREVRAHEQAHANVGGQYAGAPSYTYQRAPDGRQYAVAGEVSIDVSPVPGDPQATIDKARIVRRAALAPAEPSSQDRAVAAEATKLEQQARAELLAQSAQGEEIAGSDASDDANTLFYVPIDETA